MRGELFTTKVVLENRAYFFNVKENRNGVVFLQVVESKSKSGEDFDRRAIVIFAEDMQQFFKGLDETLAFISKDKKERTKLVAKPRSADKTANTDESAHGKRIYRKKSVSSGDAPRSSERSGAKNPSKSSAVPREESKNAGIKRTGRVHIVSKKK
jgi:hypothetical protein